MSEPNGNGTQPDLPPALIAKLEAREITEPMLVLSHDVLILPLTPIQLGYYVMAFNALKGYVGAILQYESGLIPSAPQTQAASKIIVPELRVSRLK